MVLLVIFLLTPNLEQEDGEKWIREVLCVVITASINCSTKDKAHTHPSHVTEPLRYGACYQMTPIEQKQKANSRVDVFVFFVHK